jgi:hypothetical protein
MKTGRALYPQDTILPSFSITAPTFNLVLTEHSAKAKAVFMIAISCFGLSIMVLYI